MKKLPFNINPMDKEDFGRRIGFSNDGGKQHTILCSFTYITPNYSIILTLEALKIFALNHNYKVIILLWDMNALANPYFKKLATLGKIKDLNSFIDTKVVELRTLALSIGFIGDNLLIYKSSDLWKRLVAFKEENLFQSFYSVLSQMKIKDYGIPSDKMSHIIQIPLDIFFANYFHRLFPEDLDEEIDFVFSSQHKEKLYLLTRELMLKSGLIKIKNPLFVLMELFPYIIYNDFVPEWDMSKDQIETIVAKARLSKRDIFSLFKYLESKPENELNSKGNTLKLDYNSLFKRYKNEKPNNLAHILSERLFKYLQEHKERYIKESGKIQEIILNIPTKQEAKKIGSVLKSHIALEILLSADGVLNTSQIAKKLGKSVATISTYSSRLRKLGLIRILPNGKLKRNIKGVKINLELGL